MTPRPTKSRRAVLTALIRDRRGVSALEFALIAPVLLVVVLGISDVVPSYLAEFNFHHTVESTGDIAAAYNQMQTSDMANVFASGAEVLAPYPSATLALRVTNIYSDGTNDYVYWSCGMGGLAPYAAKSKVTTTPTGFPIGQLVANYSLGVNTSFIMSEGTYTFTPITQLVITKPISMSTTSYLQPRSSAYVGFPWDGNSNDAPPVPTATTTTASVTLSNGAVCNYAK